MNLMHWAVTYSIRGLLRIVCRVHDDHLSRVPRHGPLILVCNHVNSLDVPLMYTHLQPRPVTGFASTRVAPSNRSTTLNSVTDRFPSRATRTMRSPDCRTFFSSGASTTRRLAGHFPATRAR